MSHGWVIATRTGEVLAKGAGPCNGKGNSLRAEGAGMLAVTVFLTLVCVYTNRNNSLTVTSWFDNQELI